MRICIKNLFIHLIYVEKINKYYVQATLEPERRQDQSEDINDRLKLLERKIDSNTKKLDSIKENILEDLLPAILSELMELRRDLRS